MDNTEKFLLAITLIVAVFAIYIAYNSSVPAPSSTNQSISIIMQGLNLGINTNDYFYSFSQSSDGYATTYKTEKLGNDSVLIIDNPLSEQTTYFLDNDTIFCMNYRGSYICSSVKTNAELAGYVDSQKLVFLNDGTILKNKDDFNYLISNNYIKINPQVTTATMAGNPCEMVNYVVDYTNITVDDAAKFGITLTSPKIFNVSFCLDNKTGYYVRSLNYSMNNLPHYSDYQVIQFKTTGLAQVNPPTNLSASADLMAALLNERQDEQSLINCYLNPSDRERCISTLAIVLKNKNLCNLVDQRKDRCLVSLVPLTKDISLCTVVSTPSFKDDCYIELAGAYKNNSYCSNVMNSSKIDLCMNASSIAPPPSQSNATNQSTGGS